MGIIIETPPEGGGSGGSSGAARASLGELSIQKESMGLFIGNQAASAGMPLFLRSQPEGIKYFNGWEAGLTSLDSSNAERFESGYASNLFDHSYNCNSIKLTNDIAAVAYGNYTDINKVVYQSENGGMYQPWTYTYNNYSIPSYTRFSSDFILPLISKGFSQLANSDGSINEDNTDFSNVFILVEYDGYTTGAANEITTRTLDKGSFELFTYKTNPGSNDQSGTFYFDDNLDFVFLKSKYSVNNYSSELATGMTGVRLSLDGVALDRANLQIQADKYRLAHTTTDFTYGFIGIKKVSIIKYTPVVECGKVDLYTRKSGRITSELALGKVQSVGHGLKNGDIIKISGARNTYGKDTVLNGLKYVQVNTTDIFSLYEDPDMGRKTETVAGSPDANWICVGNVYANYLPDGWELKKTIFSPTGRNGYCVKTDDPDDVHYVTYGQEKNTSLKSEFSDCDTMYDLFVKDLGYQITYQYAVLNETIQYDPFVSKIPVRAYPSSLDFLWSREDNYISGYKFGCDIDLKLIDGVYYLLVGERGIESHFMYPSTRTTILPANTPTGKAHLFVLSLDSNKNLTYSHQKTFSATSGDSSISRPDQISVNTDNYVNCYVLSSQNTNSASYNISQQQVLLDKYVSTDNFLIDDYWFGAYLFHFDIFNSTSYNGDFPYRCAYFSNFCPPDLTFTTNGYVNRVLFSHDMYPYCDSFGKSVCLSNDSSGLIIIASSKNKTQLYANNHIYTINNFATTRSHISCIPTPYNDIYSAVDCGYVHCIIYSGSTVNKINKLSHPGVQTISGGIDPQYVRAEAFAKTIRVHNGILYFGCSRAEEFYDTKYFTTSDPNVPVNVSPLNNPVTIDEYLYHSTATSVPIFTNEKSCIYSYSYANGIYSLLGKIESENSNNHYYQVQVLPNTAGRYIDYCPNQKPLTIQNKKYRNKRVYDHTSYEYGDVLFFPGDRFGDYFDINKSLLVTNSLDIINDRGILHTDISEGPDRACDYIHIYEKVSGVWKIVSKISATINSTDTRYSYESLYDNGSDCISSLRNLGNYNFSNSSSSSKTWDIDLTNSYVVADDRVVLKDPFGYSVFRRQPGQLSSSSGSSALVSSTTPVYPYFKFDEYFSAIYNTGSFDQLCNFSHKKFGSLYDYNLNSYVVNGYSPGGFGAYFLTPTYFFSLPNSYSDYSNNKFVITLDVAEVTGTGNLQLKLHSKDPRLNVVADYINNFTYGCIQDSLDYLHSDKDPSGESIFSKGVLSSEDSEIISPKSITDSGLDYKTYVFEIPLSKINQYLLFQNQLKNTTRTSNGESLVLNDFIKDTYDPSVEIINTVIISLCFDNKSYSVPQFDQDKNYEIISISANLVFPTSMGSSFDQQSGSLYSSGVYNCIYNKVATYAYNTILNNCSSGEKVYTNPVLGLGTSVSSAYSVYTPNNYTGDIADSYQMISVDKYNFFDAPNKITGSDLVSVTSLDLQPMKYLPLHMSTASAGPSGQINLFTNSSNNVSSDVSFSIFASVLIDNSTNLFLGPSTYSSDVPLYIRAIKGGIIDGGSGSSTGDLGLNIPYTTSLIGTQLNLGVTLNLKTVDSGSQVNLFVKGPTANSSNTNLYILPRSYSLPENMNLFAKASFIQSSASNLVMSGNSPGNLNLVLNGPTETNNLVPLIMFSPTTNSSGSISLVSYEIPHGEFPLYIRAPEIGSANTTLFTKYDLKYANSIDNAPSSSCEAYPNDVPFDITSGMAESLISGSNSISGPNYSTGEIFGYEPNQIPIDQIDSDYKFYRYGRFQKVTDTNGSVLAIGTREGGRPKLLIFSLFDERATLIEKKDPYVGLADSSQVFGDCLVLDVKVSTLGNIAISSYIEIKNLFGQFTRGYFIVSVYDAQGSYISEWNRSFDVFSEDAFMANHMGMTLCWMPDESLLYTKEVGILGTIQERIAPNYDADQLFYSMDQLSGYSILYQNWLNGNVPFYRAAFGHRILWFNNTLFVTCPLLDIYASVNVLTSYRYPKFSGNVTSFTGGFIDSQYDSVAENNLFGYDMSIGGIGYVSISSAKDNSIWIGDTGLLFDQNSSSDLDFGISIQNCNNIVYSVLGSSLYSLNGKSFSYSGIDDEIAPYIPSGNTILSKQEKIRGSVISAGLHLVFREFDVTYGFGTRTKFNKISLLKQSKKYETPTLFIKNQGLDSGINLTLETIKIKDSSINMSTGGVYDGQDGCSLFIRQIPDGGMDNALPLKLQGNDPVEWADQVGLALYGTFTSNTFFLSSPESTLFIGADNSFTNNVLLKIQGPDSASLDSSIPLSMNMFPASTVWQNATSPSLGINIMNTQTVEQNWQMNKGNSTLYLNSTYGTSGGLPLWIVRKGPGGGEELEASSNLTIKNKDVVSGVSLYTNAIYGIGNNVSLVFTPSAGTKNKDMKIQIFGYKE